MASNTPNAYPAHATNTKGDAGHSIVLKERFEPNAMLACLAHPGFDTATKRRLKAMYSKRIDGNGLCVTYNKSNKKGFGRLYADKGLSLQMLPSDIRNALCQGLVHDVDMVNAHPSLELHLAKKHGWVCARLERLCCDRDHVLQEVQQAYGIDRGDAKKALLKLLYLGGLPVDHQDAKTLQGLACGDIDSFEAPGSRCGPYTYLEELQAELRQLASNIAAQYPMHAREAARQRAANNKTSGHPLATAVSLVVGDLENRALLSMMRELQVQSRCVTTLVYDGLHVLKLEGEAQLPPELLRACEEAITRDTGVDIRLAQKPMETTLHLLDQLDLEGDSDPYTICRLKLLADAQERGLIRMWGEIWEPVPDSICAYQPVADSSGDEQLLRAHINSVLADIGSYHEKHDTQSKLVTYLEQYQHKHFPMVAAPDRDLLSFANGVYVLSEDRFISNGGPQAADMHASGRIARHHIPMEFTGSTDTPKFDKLVTYQLEDPAAHEWFLALLGRMQYRVGQLDNWQVMLYMYGVGGTGKSTALKIYSKAFRPGAVQHLSGNTEEVFGLQKLASSKTEAIMCLDVPSDKPTSAVLKQDLWQLLVCGEEVNVPHKNAIARSCKIQCPIAMAGNRFLDYKDCNGNVSRRVAAVRYERYLPAGQQDGDLEHAIVAAELPAIIKRCNQLYLQHAHADGSKGIWRLLPEYYTAIKHAAAETVNPLREFLSAPRPTGCCSETRYYALHAEGAMTPQSMVVMALQTYMRVTYPGVKAPSKWSQNGDEMQPLYEEGYQRKQVMLCKACRQQHKAGCCEQYGPRNKTTEVQWLNLKLVAVEPGYAADDSSEY